MAVAGLVLGILSIIGGSIPVANAFPMWLFGIIGIIISSIARKKQRSGMATAGLVLSIIGTVYSFIFFLACAVCAAGAAAASLGSFGRW
jgi:hypothetical protein